MKNIMVFLVGILAALFLVQLKAIAEEKQCENVIILIDLSDSALHVSNEMFARKAAFYIGNIIEGLPLGSVVELRTFGEYNISKNLFSYSFMVSRRNGNHPEQIKRDIMIFLSNLPKLVREGKLVLQKTTSIIGELKILSQRIDKNSKTMIIILSDMLEFSSDADCYKLITSNNSKLPEASGILKNVDVIALGAGYGCKNSTENDRLKTIWTEWFAKAGAREFHYLSDF